MTDRWVQVQGGPPTLIFTINDLYGSAAVCIKNRSTTKAERVSVQVKNKNNNNSDETTTTVENNNNNNFTFLCDPQGANTISGSTKELEELTRMMMSPNTSSSSSSSNSTSTIAFAIIPPDATVVAAVISPKVTSSNSELKNLHKLPPGLVVQVHSVLNISTAENAKIQSIAEVTLTEAEMKSREIDQWLKSRKQRIGGGDGQ